MFWVYSTYLGKRLLSLLRTAILARILVPEDFGLFSFAVLVITYIEIVRGFGIREALIYNTGDHEDAADAAFWSNIAMGLAQFSVAFLAAPLAVRLIDDPRIVNLVRVLAFNFIFISLSQTHDTLLQKELKFRRRVMPDLASGIVFFIVAVALAYMGYGVWSPIIGNVAGSAARMVVLWSTMSWRPRFRLVWAKVRSLWSYGIHLLLFGLLGTAMEYADQSIIGVLLGAIQLGYFTIASRIPEMVIANLSLILTEVLFPIYTKLKDEREKLTEAYLKTTKYTAFATTGAAAGMAAVAPEMILVLFGNQWEPAIPLLQVLAFLGLALTIPWAAGDVLKAIGKPGVNTVLLATEALYTFPLIWFMTQRNPLAVTASTANLIAASIAAVVRLIVISRYLKFNPLIFFRVFVPSFLSGAVMYLVVTYWRWLISGMPNVVVLITSVVVGLAVYGSLMFVLEKKDILIAIELIRDMYRKRFIDDEDEDDLPVVPPVPANPEAK
jgi:PST family polysaccharide transporter